MHSPGQLSLCPGLGTHSTAGFDLHLPPPCPQQILCQAAKQLQSSGRFSEHCPSLQLHTAGVLTAAPVQPLRALQHWLLAEQGGSAPFWHSRPWHAHAAVKHCAQPAALEAVTKHCSSAVKLTTWLASGHALCPRHHSQHASFLSLCVPGAG